MRVVVVGAGMGGLSAAVALLRAEVDLVVLEQAPALQEVGAGLSLWPNAVHALRHLDVWDAVEALGAHIGRGDVLDRRGVLLHGSSTRPVEERFGAPVTMVHRADLQSLLRASLHGEQLRLGVRCVRVDQDASGVEVVLSDGSVERGDVAVGADGLRSVVRASTLADGPPGYSGLTAWRAVVTVDAPLAARVAGSESWGDGSVFGMQRLPGDRVYWYAATRAGQGEAASSAGHRADLLDRFGGWHDPVPALVRATEEAAVLRNDLYDRPPPRRLASGRVALLGDAAHPMLPYLGQGACQAITDGVALSMALGGTPDIRTALEAYTDRRLAQTAAAVTQSRRAARLAHLRAPLAVALRRAVLRVTPLGVALRQLEPVLAGDHIPVPHRHTPPHRREGTPP
jgi:2-polyprenyl-6-methoxyphenol hydroxylase-like FAD-dependent oxidoreductase